MKKCSICKECKELSGFSVDKNSKDGKRSACKACLSIDRKNYHERNKDEENQKSMLYYFFHKDELNKKRSEYAKTYYVENKEKINARGKIYRENHPDITRKHVWNRRSRLANAGGGGISESQWKELLSFYGNKCLCCGKTGKLHLDHIIPLSKGGIHDISNVQPLCGACNSRKGTKTIDYRGTHV